MKVLTISLWSLEKSRDDVLMEMIMFFLLLSVETWKKVVFLSPSLIHENPDLCIHYISSLLRRSLSLSTSKFSLIMFSSSGAAIWTFINSCLTFWISIWLFLNFCLLQCLMSSLKCQSFSTIECSGTLF